MATGTMVTWSFSRGLSGLKIRSKRFIHRRLANVAQPVSHFLFIVTKYYNGADIVADLYIDELYVIIIIYNINRAMLL